ncbi:MAG: FHA domain-containing protein [Chloroflexota bacterium]
MNELVERPVLIAQTGKLDGARWVLEQDQVLIGRGPECDLVVPDRQVSRQHALIRRTKNGYTLKDLGSKNGTHLNGTPVEGEVPLQDGDVIQIGLVLRLVFVGTESTIPLKREGLSKMGLGRLRMDPQSHRVWVGRAEIEPPLSPPQYRLLELMYQNPDKVVTREQIVRHVWPESLGEGVSEQAIDALVRRLRERLSELDPGHPYVVTVRGHGLRLNNPI